MHLFINYDPLQPTYEIMGFDILLFFFFIHKCIGIGWEMHLFINYDLLQPS